MEVASTTISLTEYYAMPGSRFSEDDAQVIGPVIAKLHEEGRSHAKGIVEEARPEQSSIHGYFEWNDYDAAEKYREDQARKMCQGIAVRVILPGSDREVTTRAFLPVRIEVARQEEVPEVHHQTEGEENTEEDEPTPTPSLKQYAPFDFVQSDTALRNQVLDEAKQNLRQFEKRFERYQNLLGSSYQLVLQAIDALE